MSLALTEIPQTIDAGTTVQYTRTYPDYPAGAGWTLTAYFAGAAVATAVATATGDSFLVTLDATATAALTPGLYTYVERVAKSGAKHDVARRTINVRADVATATAGSLQSWEEKTLVVVEAALSGQLTDGMASYQIHGRAVSRIPLSDLKALRNELVTSIRQKRSGRFSTTVPVRFSSPGWGGRG